MEIDDERAAREFEAGFQQAYLRFHRRDGKRSEVSSASRGLLTHLALSGPVTVGDLAEHLDRAQSVVSELVTRLAGKGLVSRERDPANGRRTLVWLTEDGIAFLQRDREVLSIDLLARTMGRMDPDDRAALLRGLRALTAADDVPAAHTSPKENDMTITCDSCGMPIETGRYCAHCTTADGTLQPFEERFEKMVAFRMGRDPGATRAEVEAATLAYLATMPAWQDHPRVRAGVAL